VSGGGGRFPIRPGEAREPPADWPSRKKALEKKQKRLGASTKKQLALARQKDEKKILQKFIDKVGKAVLFGCLIAGLSVIAPQLTPLAIAMYETYKVGEIGTRILSTYKTVDKSKFDEDMKEGSKETAKLLAGEIAGRLPSGKASTIAHFLVSLAQESGEIEKRSRETSIDRDTYTTMLEGSIKAGLRAGVSEIIAYSIEESVGG
jgi:hypothetical protein